MKKYIEVQWQFEGVHCWPQAPEPVAYLRDPHRHIFHCKARVEVFHEERELEFIMLKHELQRLKIPGDITHSCERMAGDIAGYLQAKYPGRHVSVWVSEDGENGALVIHEN